MPSRFTPRFWLLCLAALAVGCPTTAPGGRPLGIVDGTRELGEPAVVLVQGVLGLCTGTLISDRVVLTAKHCVISRGVETPAPPTFFSVGVGSSSGDVTPYRVREVITTPGGYFGSAITDGSDIALLILRAPVPDVVPLPVRRAAPTDLVGREVTAVGFGTTPSGEIGIKYRTTTTLRSVTGQVLTAQNAICQGDSGGPIILEGDGTTGRAIVGVASYGQTVGPSATCPAALDAWNRVDLERALIDGAVLRSGGCVETGEESCNALDDDCDGTTDEGCRALGESCEADGDCAFAALPDALAAGAPPSVRCAMVGGARRCALPCDPLAPAQSCASMAVPFRSEARALEGFYCASQGACEGLCVPGAAGAGAPGGPCAAPTDCASLRCESGLCANPCRGGAGACPADEVCGAEPLGCGVCGSSSLRSTGRGTGEPCEAASSCASGVCGAFDGGSICTSACATDAECGTGARCEGGWCTPGARAQLFDACELDADCSGGVCVGVGSTRFCSIACTGDAACGGGRCSPVDGIARCVPTDPVLGAPCTGPCAQGECVGGLCTARCGGEAACPLGQRCVRDGLDTLCRPRTSSGGCAVTAVPRGGVPWSVALVVMALGSWGRRSRRRPRR